MANISQQNSPVSIILPTRDFTAEVSSIAGQLSRQDELVIVADQKEEGVVNALENNSYPNINLVVAGDPVNSSGKANAVYQGIKEAKNDRLVITHSDFNRPDDWLEKLREDCDKYGAVNEIPFFKGKNWLTEL